MKINWEEAFITMGISDLRGIKEELKFKWDNRNIPVQSGSHISSFPSGFTVPSLGLGENTVESIPFEMVLKLQGSGKIGFVPTGSISNVSLSSSWPSPSFDGNFLPDEREIRDDGFSASWKVLQLNRNYPSSWYGDTHFMSMIASSFGVSLHSGTGNYQKSIRSAKYGVMIIALTFLIFFLFEIVQKRNVHPFQYALIGLSLSLFFVLLVALSEHMSYEQAYLSGALSIVSMISLYSLSVFKNKKMTMVLALVLVVIYTFMYFTLQSSDYALLIGSIGLTAILGGAMYYTRNIEWYGKKKTNL